MKYKTYKEIVLNNRNFDFNFINQIENRENLSEIMNYFSQSHSQLRQDLFVLNQLKFKKNGFFVEFGATNGINLSNTYLLEKKFNWDGILAEPAKVYHEELTKNRNCYIEKNLVWKNSGSTLIFIEASIKELSTIKQYFKFDTHVRENDKQYPVDTISLNNLLKKYNAPDVIDYLSIDTEGSEFDILNNFNFNSYQFRVITCEHNHTSNRDKIYSLLSSNGYKRIMSNISQFDDWYINTSII
ncbi:MAG: FkbM family methyltransferase [Candidatus Fonsibacter sp.]|nr:FkbM family methyltransferase [Candidatus Fonsibacter sp.]